MILDELKTVAVRLESDLEDLERNETDESARRALRMAMACAHALVDEIDRSGRIRKAEASSRRSERALSGRSHRARVLHTSRVAPYGPHVARLQYDRGKLRVPRTGPCQQHAFVVASSSFLLLRPSLPSCPRRSSGDVVPAADRRPQNGTRTPRQSTRYRSCGWSRRSPTSINTGMRSRRRRCAAHHGSRISSSRNARARVR